MRKIKKNIFIAILIVFVTIFASPVHSARTFTYCVADLQDGRQAAIQGVNDAQSCFAKAQNCSNSFGWPYKNATHYSGGVWIDWRQQGNQALICN